MSWSPFINFFKYHGKDKHAKNCENNDSFIKGGAHIHSCVIYLV